MAKLKNKEAHDLPEWVNPNLPLQAWLGEAAQAVGTIDVDKDTYNALIKDKWGSTDTHGHAEDAVETKFIEMSWGTVTYGQGAAHRWPGLDSNGPEVK